MRWKRLLLDALKTAVVAFVVLQLKEYYDAHQFDTSGTAADGGLVGVGVFLVGAVQKFLTKSK
jgi:hypothetical protein